MTRWSNARVELEFFLEFSWLQKVELNLGDLFNVQSLMIRREVIGKYTLVRILLKQLDYSLSIFYEVIVDSAFALISYHLKENLELII